MVDIPKVSSAFATLTVEEKAALASSLRAHAKIVIASASITKPDGRARHWEAYIDGSEEVLDDKGQVAAWDLE